MQMAVRTQNIAVGGLSSPHKRGLRPATAHILHIVTLSSTSLANKSCNLLNHPERTQPRAERSPIPIPSRIARHEACENTANVMTVLSIRRAR